MDAPPENDLRLQRVSTGLLDEFEALLPQYLWASRVSEGLHHAQKDQVCRRFVKHNKTNSLIKLVGPKLKELRAEDAVY